MQNRQLIAYFLITAVFLGMTGVSAFTIGDNSCAGTENSLYIYDFNETPDDWGYVSKLGDENIDYNVETVNTSYNSLINGTALHFNASSTGTNDGILFDYEFQDHSNNLSLGFPMTTVEFDLYNVSMSGLVYDISFVARQVNWTTREVLEYSFFGSPVYFDDTNHYHVLMNSYNFNSEAQGYDCIVWDLDTGIPSEEYYDWSCPYVIDDELTNFYLIFNNDGDDDAYIDFVIDNLIVSQNENFFNSPVDCVNKEGFPYVHGYVMHNLHNQGFSEYLYDDDGDPIGMYRCQNPLDNQFALESFYNDEFVQLQPEYSSRDDLYSDYPEYSLMWRDDDTNEYYFRSNYAMRSDVIFFGTYNGCIDIQNYCNDRWYEIYEPELGSVPLPDGWLYNKTKYNPVIVNKTPTYVCGNADSQDTLETVDVILQNDGTWDSSPYNLRQFGEDWNDFELTWLPYRDYDTCWDCINSNMTAYWEKRILDENSGLCAYYASFGITPCPLESVEDYLYCDAPWVVDNDFVVETTLNYQNNLTETVQIYTNQTTWLDDFVHSNVIETWYEKNESLLSSYMDLWNTTISEYYTTGLCRNDVEDYNPYNYLSAGTPDQLKSGYGYPYSATIGGALNYLEGSFTWSMYIPNNYTVDINDSYNHQDLPFKDVYIWTRNIDPLLEVANHVSITVPIETNVSSYNLLRYYSAEEDELEYLKIGNTIYLTERISESHPTWSNSLTNYTVEITVCKQGMWWDSLAEDCYDTPTWFAVLGNRNTGLMSAMFALGLLGYLAYFFTRQSKKGGKLK